ncbi:branched-chain amino acid aminotransferase [Sphaerisporangium rubeum]|uniref:Branched-chain-amino-acid aminotransferase n=1 Tax=Sphaerisporangium rubeum TaxID=321317 RepID=A0A7X0IGM0_9ACTN|nr:branched-chain amino acid aminotransferase [Sphaerisporangium rubeum]MBB6474869.1 branched-chain amino acid aminotransferase [Sphaerisporangium rubeum]
MTTIDAEARHGETGLDGAQIGGFTAHMVTMRWTVDEGWTGPVLGPRTDLSLPPATAVLHTGQSIIEGLAAHRQQDGTVAIFRPRDHARRFQRSARRLSMPPLPEEHFVRALETLVAADHGAMSDQPGWRLYLRPFMFASEENLVPRPAREFTFVAIAMIIGNYFGEDIESLSVWVCRDFPRAFPGGTGDVKYAGNYAPTLLAQTKAGQAGCHQVVWLDAAERRWIEEMGSANLFFVRGTGSEAVVVTPELTGSFLPGVTRDTVLALAARLGYTVRHERMSPERWREECASGEITETFASGTATVVTAVGSVTDGESTWAIGDGTPGPVSRAVHQLMIDSQHGRAADPAGWRHPVRTPA